MYGEPGRILHDAVNSDAVVARLNNEVTVFWKGRLNIDNFVAIFTYYPGAFHVTVTKGIKNPDAQNLNSPKTFLGHVFNVDPRYAECIMSIPV